jgi:hypothetical protein
MSPEASIYDAATNQWVQTLMVPAMLSEKNHLYHVKSSIPENAHIILAGTVQNQLDSNDIAIEITGENQILCDIVTLPNLVDEDDHTIIEPVNLSKFIFRQRTMELLYAASKVNVDNKSIVNLKKLLKNFFKQMRLYMEANDLSEDTFMKILCEDIHLSYVTLGTSEGCMLSESRNTSQRQQTLYRSGSESCQKQRPNHITRQNALCDGIEAENVDEDTKDIENYNAEFIREDIYSTQETIEITRAVSG